MSNSDFDLGRERVINDLRRELDYWEQLSGRLEVEVTTNFYYGVFVGAVITGLFWLAWWLS